MLGPKWKRAETGSLSFFTIILFGFLVIFFLPTQAKGADESAPALKNEETPAADSSSSFWLPPVEQSELVALTSSFFSSARERVSILFTFDTLEKAKKQLTYIEARLQKAEALAEEAKDGASRQKAERAIAEAEDMLYKLSASKEKWEGKAQEETAKISERISSYTERRERILSTMASFLSDEELKKFSAFREQMTERAKKVLKDVKPEALKGIPQKLKETIPGKENVPEKAKDLIKDIKNFDLKKTDKTEATTSEDFDSSKTEERYSGAEEKAYKSGQKARQKLRSFFQRFKPETENKQDSEASS